MAIFVVHNTLGAALIGVVITAALWGVTVIQTWYYYSQYPKDKLRFKLIVAVLLIFDTLHQAMITHTVYWYLVTNYNHPPALSNIVWSIMSEVLMNGLTGLVVQGFLTYRVWTLSHKNIPVTVMLVALVICEFASAIAFTTFSLRGGAKFHELSRVTKGVLMVNNALGATVDVLIAAALCYWLHKARTGFQSSDSIISRCMIFTVNTGVLTSIFAVASSISILVWPDTFICLAFYFSLGRLYSNSMLATLNARQNIRKQDDLEYHSTPLRDVSRGATLGSSTLEKERSIIAIKVDTNKDYGKGHFQNESPSTYTDYKSDGRYIGAL